MSMKDKKIKSFIDKTPESLYIYQYAKRKRYLGTYQ